MNSKSFKVFVIYFFVSIAIFIGLIYGSVTYFEKNLDKNTSTNIEQQEFLIEDSETGKKFILNPDIQAILLLGTDSNKHSSIKEYNGQCDLVVLAVINSKSKSLNLLVIPRETMTDIIRKDTQGNFVDKELGQIALAHAYGIDDEDSIKLCQQAVSNLLYGIPINKTVRLQVEGITAANRSEEHTSELQPLRRITYAVFCLNKIITSSYSYISSLTIALT